MDTDHITQLEYKIKALEEENKLKDIHFASLVHELKNPIHVLNNSITLLKESFTQLSQESKMHLVTAQDCCELTINMISNILDSTKLKLSKLQINTQSINTKEFIYKISSLGKTQAMIKGLDWISILDPFIPSEIIVDANRINQIVINLLSNSSKFTKTGKLILIASWINSQTNELTTPSISLNDVKVLNLDEIKVLLYNKFKSYHSSPTTSPSSSSSLHDQKDKPQQKHYLKIEIIDTGIGISAQDQQNLFEPFAQANKTILQKFGGNGLGLWLCKKFIELMDGNLVINSIEGQGSNFIFYVPIIPAKYDTKSTKIGTSPIIYFDYYSSLQPSNKPNPSTVEQCKSTKSTLSHLKILFADDSNFNQLVTRSLIEKLGGEIHIVDNGEMLLEAFRSKPFYYDVIITDIQMPVIDGKKAIEMLRIEETTRKIPNHHVIFISGCKNNEEIKVLLDPINKYKALEFLEKPFSNDKLISILSKLQPRNKFPLLLNPQYNKHRRFSQNQQDQSEQQQQQYQQQHQQEQEQKQQQHLLQYGIHKYKPDSIKVPSKNMMITDITEKALIIYDQKPNHQIIDIEDIFDDNSINYTKLILNTESDEELTSKITNHMTNDITIIILLMDKYTIKKFMNMVLRLKSMACNQSLINSKLFIVLPENSICTAILP